MLFEESGYTKLGRSAPAINQTKTKGTREKGYAKYRGVQYN
jgi:hypothetical protein